MTSLLGLTALMAAMLSPTGASAAPADFYQAPSPLPAGRPGAVVRTEPAAVLATALTATATTVMYHSRDARGADV
ncbi:lipase, partial [Amycolatopsis sp. NPDC023774]